jgi:hypothetical protein
LVRGAIAAPMTTKKMKLHGTAAQTAMHSPLATGATGA